MLRIEVLREKTGIGEIMKDMTNVYENPISPLILIQTTKGQQLTIAQVLTKQPLALENQRLYQQV